MTRPRILVAQPIHPDVLERLSALGEVDLHLGPEPLPPEVLARRLHGADALIGFMTERIDAQVLRGANRLRVVACALKGSDNYDAQACAQAGVWLCVVPDLLTEPTAELAVGLAIGLGRQVRHGDAVVRSGAFRGWRPQLYGAGLADATVAVIGMGRVGRAIIDRLRGFGCRLIGVDRAARMPVDVEALTLDEALVQADCLIVALPLTDDTWHLIGERELQLTRRGARWVNIGRGSVVDEAAMARQLASGQVGGYAADVFECEDWHLTDRPADVALALREHPDTLFTPHLGSAVVEVRRAIEHRAVDNVEAVLRGRQPKDAINRIG
jgi:phosphonate dehydrogenase